ncbi:choice-of-anchor J domain-containing protein [uncultured Fluviicola sp.]|uniref:T9SS-dependent choice-of-anchor J family protein n=1 Tax=uncultured Fluviicola sp. TaxID=463303 RepID=UPI0025FC166E|nr:choice-of-anchor J domain-containing protein [uncultured Fluviicola sp.]
MKTSILKTAAICGLFVLGCISKYSAQAYTESFDDITLLTGNGWLIQNNSTPVGSISWFQGTATNATPTPGPFDSYTGAANSYIGVNFNSTGSTGTISNWLITPNRTLKNGDVFTFYTRKPTIGAGQTDYPDRLEVRLSTNGASTNVGSGATATGDFTTLLLSVNPTLVAGVYPQVWTQYTITISGLPAPTSGRIAFRYFVTGAGSLGSNSDYIGIDQVVYTPYVCPAFTMTTGGALTGGTAGSAYSLGLTQTGALGAPSYAITAGALPPGLTLSASGTISGTPTATGTFNFTATVSDASGCSGSQAYSITVVCPPNPISFTPAPALCDNGSAYTLVQGSPAGGTYSGAGVSGGTFNPAMGTQTVTYDYTDPYGCSFNSNYTITVNTAPMVSLGTFAAVCDNAGTIALTGGTPAGGTYSGTGVTGTDFDPASGTQTITYTYTDANSCTNTDAQLITVNTAPTVSQGAISAVCSNSGMLALTGGSPAGGSYSGTGVSGSDFDPASGTQTITYTFTDANGCMNDASTTITVNDAPTVTQDPISAVCSNSGVLALTGGSPAGGVYSGTGVTGTDFDPASGTQTITYTFTDGNGCAEGASTTITVNTAPTVAFVSPVSSMCLNHAPLTLSGGTPVGGTYSGTGVTGGSFNPVTAGIGNHVITYSFTDVNGCEGEATFTMNVSGCLGLAENGQDLGLEVYPNPTNGKFIAAASSGAEFSIVSVMDVQGKEVQFVSSESVASVIEVDLSGQKPGVYFVKGFANGEHFIFRIQKQ